MRKLIAILVLLTFSASAQVPFQPGAVLTAQQLNTAFATSVITSGSVNGASVGAINPSTGRFTTLSLTTPLSPSYGGHGVANNPLSTMTLIGAFPIAFTTTGSTSLTLPTSGTLSALGNTTTGSGSVVLATSPTLVTPNIGAATGTSLIVSGQLSASVATGTAPLVVTSTTVVPNLNVSQLLGSTWASPGAIGTVTPTTAAFTTVSTTGQITSTLVTGTAPLVVASTTNVANLNASSLGGATFASPGTIGSGTPSTGAFTSITGSSATITGTVTLGALQTVSPTTQVGATYTVASNDTSIIANRAGTVTLTLPAAASTTGRALIIRTIQAQTVVSASSNVVPLVGGAAGTAILAATAGKWAFLHSDGTNWQIMMGN